MLNEVAHLLNLAAALLQLLLCLNRARPGGKLVCPAALQRTSYCCQLILHTADR